MTHITASVALDYVPIIIMLQIGGREEIYTIHGVPCRGKGVSFWFDSSRDRYASAWS